VPVFTTVNLYLGYSIVFLILSHVSPHDIASGSAAMPCWQKETIWWASEELKELPPVCSLNGAWRITSNICASNRHRMFISCNIVRILESTIL